MADGRPKDYSSMDQEDSPPVPPLRNSINTHQHNTIRYNNHNNSIKLHDDGSNFRMPHREFGGIDLDAVAKKLRELSPSNFAMDSLRVHYSDVFGTRKNNHEQQPPLPPPTSANNKIKAVINYVDEKEVYIINVPQNTAKMVKNLAPKRGIYRYFFELADGAYEEMETNDVKVPVHQKDNGIKCIRCKVFNA